MIRAIRSVERPVVQQQESKNSFIEFTRLISTLLKPNVQQIYRSDVAPQKFIPNVGG